MVKAGIDPVSEWNKPPAEQASTFEKAVADYLQAHSRVWRNEKHRAQWTSTLATYAYPVFGDRPVVAVDADGQGPALCA